MIVGDGVETTGRIFGWNSKALVKQVTRWFVVSEVARANHRWVKSGFNTVQLCARSEDVETCIVVENGR